MSDSTCDIRKTGTDTYLMSHHSFSTHVLSRALPHTQTDTFQSVSPVPMFIGVIDFRRRKRTHGPGGSVIKWFLG